MDRRIKPILTTLVSTLMLTASLSANADTLKEAVARTVHTNPDVLTTARQRSAASETVGEARGKYFPQIDLNADWGRDRAKNFDTVGRWITLTRHDTGVSLKQMIFDGFLTPSEVARTKASTNAAAYRVYGSAEDNGLLAVQAYLDVLRTRELARNARENLAVHNGIFHMISERTKRGVGRGADQEQANARVELARANLMTAESDERNAVTTYYKITGQMPDGLASPPIPTESVLPPDEATAEQWALEGHPTLKSAIADIQQARAQHRAAKAAFWPTLSLNVGATWGHNVDGVSGPTDEQFALLELDYNLSRGGTDVARARETAYQVQQASEIRNHTERQVVESMRLSWDALITARSRLTPLRLHKDLSSQTLHAYREQFNVSKRTLLDVLDSQNEYFTASDDLVNGRYAEIYAKYRILNSMGALNRYLCVALPEEAIVPYGEVDKPNQHPPIALDPEPARPYSTYTANTQTGERAVVQAQGDPVQPLTAQPQQSVQQADAYRTTGTSNWSSERNHQFAQQTSPSQSQQSDSQIRIISPNSGADRQFAQNYNGQSTSGNATGQSRSREIQAASGTSSSGNVNGQNRSREIQAANGTSPNDVTEQRRSREIQTARAIRSPAKNPATTGSNNEQQKVADGSAPTYVIRDHLLSQHDGVSQPSANAISPTQDITEASRETQPLQDLPVQDNLERPKLDLGEGLV